MEESRTLRVPKEITETLRTPPVEMTFDAMADLVEWMPEAMTPEEIDHLGVQLANAAELERPSWDGYRRGRRQENTALLTLGDLALRREDIVTAKNVSRHLRRWPWTTEGLVGSLMLKRSIAKSSRQIVDTLLSSGDE